MIEKYIEEALQENHLSGDNDIKESVALVMQNISDLGYYFQHTIKDDKIGYNPRHSSPRFKDGNTPIFATNESTIAAGIGLTMLPVGLEALARSKGDLDVGHSSFSALFKDAHIPKALAIAAFYDVVRANQALVDQEDYTDIQKMADANVDTFYESHGFVEKESPIKIELSGTDNPTYHSLMSLVQDVLKEADSERREILVEKSTSDMIENFTTRMVEHIFEGQSYMANSSNIRKDAPFQADELKEKGLISYKTALSYAVAINNNLKNVPQLEQPSN